MNRTTTIGILLIIVVFPLLWWFTIHLDEKPIFIGQSSDKIAITQGNTLLPIVSVFYPDIQVLATIIISCENPSGIPTMCNQQFGCIAGMGDFQLIPTTVKYCEEKLGRPINPFIKEDNHACGIWLLENEGTYHWGTEDTWWGSYDCWSKKI
tara:strand:+ start:476 stop:931 length:456 start_codon:yes stop_codon:yes gene_type:complete